MGFRERGSTAAGARVNGAQACLSQQTVENKPIVTLAARAAVAFDDLRPVAPATVRRRFQRPAHATGREQ